MRTRLSFPLVKLITTAADASANSIGCPVPQLQVHLLASRDRWRKCHVRDEVARLKHRFAMRRVAGQKVKISDRDLREPFNPCT